MNSVNKQRDKEVIRLSLSWRTTQTKFYEIDYFPERTQSRAWCGRIIICWKRNRNKLDCKAWFPSQNACNSCV